MLLSHHQALIRDALASLVEGSSMRLTGTAESPGELNQLARERKPDVILFDWDSVEDPMQTAKDLALASPESATAALVTTNAFEGFALAVQAGVKGVISVNRDGDEFEQAMRLIARRDLVVSRQIADQIEEAGVGVYGSNSLEQLSDREMDVLGLIAQGATNKEIAESLILAESTVKVHLRTILDKLNLRNRQHAAAYAARGGMDVEGEAEAI